MELTESSVNATSVSVVTGGSVAPLGLVGQHLSANECNGRVQVPDRRYANILTGRVTTE